MLPANAREVKHCTDGHTCRLLQANLSTGVLLNKKVKDEQSACAADRLAAAGRDDVEAIFILPTRASVDAFKAFDADLDRIAEDADKVYAYGVDKKEAFEAPLAGVYLQTGRG